MDMNENLTSWLAVDKKVGICVKDSSRKILSQNQVSQRICGPMMGQVCSKSCMKFYQQLDECATLTQGMVHYKNADIESHKVDAVVINDGEHLTTFFYPLEEDASSVQKREEYFRTKGLTKSEMRVMEFILQGKSNAQIAEQLYISKATLKTHINNVYKKLPPSFKQLKIR
jgi:ATP/maltotriose-dependent transcriptional regulator MalT